MNKKYTIVTVISMLIGVASLDEGLIHVTTLMVNYYRGQRMQSKNKEAPAIIYSILNNQDNVK